MVPIFYCMLLRRKSIALRSFSPSLFLRSVFRIFIDENSLSTDTCVGGRAERTFVIPFYFCYGEKLRFLTVPVPEPAPEPEPKRNRNAITAPVPVPLRQKVTVPYGSGSFTVPVPQHWFLICNFLASRIHVLHF